jgi:hypothetical protein
LVTLTPNVQLNECNANELGKSYVNNGDLKDFSLRFRDAAAGKYVYFLWYRIFNKAIVNYYAAQDNLPDITALPERTKTDRTLFAETYTPDLLAPESFYVGLFNYALSKSDFVVIPEQLEAYEALEPSPIVAHRNDIAAALNSPEISPEFLVWAVIDEYATRVLVLKRRDGSEADANLEPFPRTWGSPSQIVGREFKGALVVHRRSQTQIEADAAPRLLYSEGIYNVVRVGDLYVAVSQQLGPLDVRDVLQNRGPRPPAQKFLVAHDISRLKVMMHACAKVLASEQP